MYVLNPATLTLRDFEPDGGMPFSKGHIFCIKQDREKNLWIGTSLGIFCYKDGRQIAHYTSANSKLPEGNVYEIYFDSTHKGWDMYREWNVHLGPLCPDIENRCVS